MANQTAFLTNGEVVIKETEIPTPESHQVIVKVISAAINQVRDDGERHPHFLGSNVAGTVHSLGSDVKTLQKDDRVLGLVSLEYSAFQNFVPISSHLLTKLPENIPFENACAIPLAAATAAVGLFEGLRLERPLPKPAMPKEKKQILLVWGGASSVGVMAIQLANHAGYHVLTTASKKNHDYLTSLGAAKNFDYHDPDVVDQIKQQGQVEIIYDAVAVDESTQKCFEILQPQGGKLTTINSPPANTPENVHIHHSLGSSVHNTNIELGRWLFNDFLQEALSQETIVTAPPVHVVDGGLRNLGRAIALRKKGVSALKVHLPVIPLTTRLSFVCN